MHLKTVIGTMRPRFLLLSLAVVLLGTALALYDGAPWSGTLFGLLMLGGMLAHATVNMQNEYEDYKSGLDALTQRTPFSGGSGGLQQHPQSAPYVLRTFIVALIGLIAIGLYLIYLKGSMLLPIGIIGVLIIVSYTSQLTRLPWLCLLSPGFAFGPLMVLGTYYVWTGGFSFGAFWLSMVPFFLVNNLLLLNQFPDVEADQKVGRYNILMRLGKQKSAFIFNGFLGLSFLMIVMAYFTNGLPPTFLISLLTIFIALPLFLKVMHYYQDSDKLMPALVMNVIITIVTPLLMAGGLFWAMI